MNNTNLFENFLGGKRGVFWFVFILVTLTIVGSSYWVVSFVNRVARDDTDVQINALSPIYVNYYSNVDEYISAASYLAMGNYARDVPEPQNVQVLTGMTTHEINGYMMNHVVAGLQVNCTYCHTLENFAADEWEDEVAMANKVNARAHLQMTADLNQNWLANLSTVTDRKKPSGAQITCATCHYGVAQPEPWPGDVAGLPGNFRLPFGQTLSITEIDVLNVNARTDISLDTVQYQQHVMYYMNSSLNVGCTHCHNSRYFPSKEVPAIYYAMNMLQMTDYINDEWGDTFNGKEPSCLMCHNEASIPPGSARSVDVLPAALVAPTTQDS